MGWEARKQRFEVQYSEGLELQRKGMWNHAIVCFSHALRFKPDDVNALLARSKCYILIGKPDKALADAEVIIVQERSEGYDRKRYGIHRGLLQKADTLYARGDFEEALLWYHRGFSQKPDIQGFTEGIKKAEAAIFSSINNAAGGGPRGGRGDGGRESVVSTVWHPGRSVGDLGSPAGSSLPSPRSPAARSPQGRELRSGTAGVDAARVPSTLTARLASPTARVKLSGSFGSLGGGAVAASPRGAADASRPADTAGAAAPAAPAAGDGEREIFGLADAVATHLAEAAIQKKEKAQVAVEKVQERKIDAAKIQPLIDALPEFRGDLHFLRDLIQGDLFDPDPERQVIINNLHEVGFGLNNNNHHANANIYSLYTSRKIRRKHVPAVPDPPPPVPESKDADLPKFGQARRSAIRAFIKKKKTLALRHRQYEEEHGVGNEESSWLTHPEGGGGGYNGYSSGTVHTPAHGRSGGTTPGAESQTPPPRASPTHHPQQRPAPLDPGLACVGGGASATPASTVPLDGASPGAWPFKAFASPPEAPALPAPQIGAVSGAGGPRTSPTRATPARDSPGAQVGEGQGPRGPRGRGGSPHRTHAPAPSPLPDDRPECTGSESPSNPPMSTTARAGEVGNWYDGGGSGRHSPLRALCTSNDEDASAADHYSCTAGGVSPDQRKPSSKVSPRQLRRRRAAAANSGRYRHYTSAQVRREHANDRVLNDLASVMEFLRERQRFWSQNASTAPQPAAHLAQLPDRIAADAQMARVARKNFNKPTSSSRQREHALRAYREFMQAEAGLLRHAAAQRLRPQQQLQRRRKRSASPFRERFSFGDSETATALRPSVAAGIRPNESVVTIDVKAARREHEEWAGMSAGRRRSTVAGGGFEDLGNGVFRVKKRQSKMEAKKEPKGSNLQKAVQKHKEEAARARTSAPRPSSRNSRVLVSSSGGVVLLPEEEAEAVADPDVAVMSYNSLAVGDHPAASGGPGAHDDDPPVTGEWYARDMPPERSANGTPFPQRSATPRRSATPHGRPGQRSTTPSAMRYHVPRPQSAAARSAVMSSTTPGLTESVPGSTTPGLGMRVTPNLPHPAASDGLHAPAAQPWELGDGGDALGGTPDSDAIAGVPQPPRPHTSMETRSSGAAGMGVGLRGFGSTLRGGTAATPYADGGGGDDDRGGGGGNSPIRAHIPVRPATSIGQRAVRGTHGAGGAVAALGLPTPAYRKTKRRDGRGGGVHAADRKVESDGQEQENLRPKTPGGMFDSHMPPDAPAPQHVDSDGGSGSDASSGGRPEPDWVPKAFRQYEAASPPPLHGYNTWRRADFQRDPTKAVTTLDAAGQHLGPPGESNWQKDLHSESDVPSTLDSFEDGDPDDNTPEANATKFVVAALAAIHSCLQYADLYSAIAVAQRLLDQVDELVIKDPHKLTADLCDLLGTCHLYTQSYVEAKKFFQRQLVLCRQTGNHQGYQKAVAQLSNTFKLGGQAALEAAHPVDLTKVPKGRRHRASKVRRSAQGLVWDPTGDGPEAPEDGAAAGGEPPTPPTRQASATGGFPARVEPLVYDAQQGGGEGPVGGADACGTPPSPPGVSVSPASNASTSSHTPRHRLSRAATSQSASRRASQQSYHSRGGNVGAGGGEVARAYLDIDSVITRRTRARGMANGRKRLSVATDEGGGAGRGSHSGAARLRLRPPVSPGGSSGRRSTPSPSNATPPASPLVPDRDCDRPAPTLSPHSARSHFRGRPVPSFAAYTSPDASHPQGYPEPTPPPQQQQQLARPSSFRRPGSPYAARRVSIAAPEDSSRRRRQSSTRK